jgi:uncharacterized protein YlzI (FlbEa/FlbD family)
MIKLHRLSAHHEEFFMNPDLIVRCEACPDTVLLLTTGKTVSVAESPQEVVHAMRAWRVEVLRAAMSVPAGAH